MTPLDLAQAIRTAPTDDAAAELLAEHERELELVAVFEADKAAEISTTREELAAERAAFADLAARQFWRGVCAERAAGADVHACQFRASAAPPQVPANLRDAVDLAVYASMDFASAFDSEAAVHRTWAGEG